MGLLLNRAATGFLHPVNNTVDKLISASNGLMCLASTIFGAPPNIGSILSGLASVAAGMISAIVNSVTQVIYNRVNQIVDSILSPIRQIQSIIADLTTTLESTQNILDKALNMNNYFQGRQNCTNMGVNLLNCLAQSAINQVSRKVAMNVDKHIGKIANDVAKQSFKVNGGIHNFVDKNTKFIAKAQLQTKLLT
jgi:hypothetical protein